MLEHFIRMQSKNLHDHLNIQLGKQVDTDQHLINEFPLDNFGGYKGVSWLSRRCYKVVLRVLSLALYCWQNDIWLILIVTSDETDLAIKLSPNYY